MNDSSGPLPAWLAPASHAAALFYGAGVRARSAMLDRRAPLRAPFPVVSVGNITAGGTGKTPFVRWVVGALQSEGHRPAIALRGYASRGGRSDEAMEYEALLPSTPVALGADRHASLARMHAADPSIDCAVLDDGFQHRRLARELEIVLIDAQRPGIGGALLPAGWLREPATALRRADLVVVTRSGPQPAAELGAAIEQLHGAPVAAWTQHGWRALAVHGAREAELPSSALQGRRVLVTAAIGNPQAFLDDARRAGAVVAGTRLYRDHASFDVDRVAAIAEAAHALDAAVLLTGKDWVKVANSLAQAPRVARDIEWIVPALEIRFLSGESEVRARLRQAMRAPRATPK